MKKPIYKERWFWGLVLILTVVGLGLTGSGVGIYDRFRNPMLSDIALFLKRWPFYTGLTVTGLILLAAAGIVAGDIDN